MTCQYPGCPNPQGEAAKKLTKPNSARLCDKHDGELTKLVDANDIPKLTAFMMRVAFKIQ